MDNQGITLRCHSAKNKLSEAEYFLETLKLPKIWNDDKKFGYHLNSFILATGFVTDYVKSDFVYHRIKPRISWQEYEDQAKRSQTIDNHPRKNIIKKFQREYDNELELLLQNPLVNYFNSKRKKISCIQWNGSKWGKLSEKNNNPKTFEKRYFEGLGPDHYKKTSGMIPLDLFDKRISEQEKEKTLLYLCKEDISQVCRKYLDYLGEFIQKFDGVKFEDNKETPPEETQIQEKTVKQQDTVAIQIKQQEHGNNQELSNTKETKPEVEKILSSNDLEYCRKQFWLL